MRRAAVVLAIGASCMMVLGAMAGQAGALVSKFKVAPAHPFVDDNVTIGWRADRNLKSGQHYQGTFTDEPLGNCAQLVILSFKARPRTGQTMRMTFSPFQDKIWGGPLWCDGKAEVSVDIVKNGSDREVAFVGITDFRFRRQP
jgi:hypothetical protein